MPASAGCSGMDGRLARARKYAILVLVEPTEILMAKGQMKSNKEKRKPKKEKDDKKAAKK